MRDLRGKRLLILGGSMWKDAIKQFADEHGIILVATGNDRSAGIFEIAHEAYDVNSTDIEGMKKLIAEKNIDGVYMGGSEPVITKACEYINDLGLPCYCNKQQWDFLQDKSNFKDLCLKFGLPCVPKYNITDSTIEYPVITKPTDGCGSNGFSVCKDYAELLVGYEKAKAASPTGSVLIEKFVNNNSVVVFYTFSEGKLIFSGLEDKFPVRYSETGSYVAGMHLFESLHKDEFVQKFEAKLGELFAHIGIKEGSLWIEVFRDNDRYYFNEVGFRYSGSVSIYPVDYFYGINQVAADIHYALTGESNICSHASLINSNVPHKKSYCVYNVHMLPGTISNICGIEELREMPEVVFIADTKRVGDNVKATGTVGQVFAFVHFVYDTEEELQQMITNIHQILHVYDGNGNDLLVNMFHT